MKIKRLFFSLAGLYLLFYIGDAFLTSYHSLYFVERGMTPEQQSILVGSLPFSIFLGCFIMGFLDKNPKMTIWLFRFSALIETIGVIIYAYCTSFWSLLLLSFILGFFNGAPFAFMDSFANIYIKDTKIPFSYIRMFGTLAYILALFAGYILLKSMPLQICHFLSCIFFALSLAFSFLWPKAEIKEEEQEIVKKEENRFSVYKNRGVIFFILSTVFIYGVFGAFFYIFPVRLNMLGASDSDYSLMRDVSVISEFIFLLIIPLFKSFFKDKRVPIIIFGVLIIISTGLGIFLNTPAAFGYTSFIFSGIGKAFLFAYQAMLLKEIVGEGKLAPVLTITTGLVNILSALLNLLSSTMYQNLGFEGYFAIVTALEILGLVFVFFIPKQKEAKVLEK
jgi:PPP family 3-phenylpropionic acid transporter